jgi:hypothetical protein
MVKIFLLRIDFLKKMCILSLGMFCLGQPTLFDRWSGVEQFILNLLPALVDFWRDERRDQRQRAPSADTALPSSNGWEISPFVEKRKGGVQSHGRT